MPTYAELYASKRWKMFQPLGRVYDNSRARDRLGWEPQYTFARAIDRLMQSLDYRSELTHQTGSKGYHNTIFDEGPYPVSSF